MRVNNKSFTLIEVIIAAVLLTIGVAGGVVGYKVADRQIEQADIKNMAMAENGRIQEMIASWDIDDNNLKETAEPRPIDISNAEFEEKYSPEAFYIVHDVTDGDGNLLYKEITVTVNTNLSGKNIKVQTQSVKTNFERSEFIPLVHNECVNGKCIEVAGAGADECNSNADCQGGGNTHNECTPRGTCIEVAGAGADECNSNADCQGGVRHCMTDGSGVCSKDGTGSVCNGAEGEIDAVCQTECIPNCKGKECGPDDCGGSCGTCIADDEYCDNGVCKNISSCTSGCPPYHWVCTNGSWCHAVVGEGQNQCSPTTSGCGKHWGCSNGSCILLAGNGSDECDPDDDQCGCIPSCEWVECGDDGCGGSCGECAEKDCYSCFNGQCVYQCSSWQVCNGGSCCTPNCSGKSCGSDGCGGDCGICREDDYCDNGVCKSY